METKRIMCGIKTSSVVITAKNADQQSVRHLSAYICLTALSAILVQIVR